MMSSSSPPPHSPTLTTTTSTTPPRRRHIMQQRSASSGGDGDQPPSVTLSTNSTSTSRIPKPSPLPLRRSLSLRLRTDGDDDQNHPPPPPSKPYNCCLHEAEEVAVFGEGDHTDCAPFGIVASASLMNGTRGCCTTTASSSSAAAAAAAATATLSNSKSLTNIAAATTAATMAHHQHQARNGTSNGAHKKEHPHQANNGTPHYGRQPHGMSLDLNPCTHNTTHHHHHHHNAAKSTEPSPLPVRRTASASRAHSYPNGRGGTVQSPLTPLTPRTPGGGPAAALRRLSPKTPPVSPDDPLTGGCYADDDLESVYSYTSMASGRSTMSCDHPFVARNGTTFSGRKMKYVVHCSSYAGQTGEDYLTPTQRAQKHIRRLKMLLSQAHMDLEQRDSEILRLTKEVVELRLFKASLTSPEDRSNSSDAVTVREMGDPKTSTDVSPIVIDPTTGDIVDGCIGDNGGANNDHDDDDDHDSVPAIMSKSVSPRHYAATAAFLEKMSHSEMQSSFADSGHFEDITTSSVHSRDSYVQTMPTASAAAAAQAASTSTAGSEASVAAACAARDQAAAEFERSELIRFYELKIEDLIKNHSDESQEVRVTHNDRVEALLQRLAECNARYADMVPDHEQAKERIRELERQLEELQQKLQEQDNKQNKMYLHMFAKGQEAERMQQADKVMELASTSAAAGGARVSVPELMQQLQVTQNELENIKDTNYVQERGNAQVLLSAKEAISLWLLGARKTMYRRLIDAQQSKSRVDPEVTLQFLKSAVYYFLTDKENTRGHLNAIESILGFSDPERKKIEQARGAANK